MQKKSVTQLRTLRPGRTLEAAGLALVIKRRAALRVVHMVVQRERCLAMLLAVRVSLSCLHVKGFGQWQRTRALCHIATL